NRFVSPPDTSQRYPVPMFKPVRRLIAPVQLQAQAITFDNLRGGRDKAADGLEHGHRIALRCVRR
ncbi:hypothetical protein, partial [Xanthomonas arboricola]|uniref:hypothetical protein n=1 Tax=Xanthomonas arboricola TaxID=56448 RepID=UPI0011B7084D